MPQNKITVGVPFFSFLPPEIVATLKVGQTTPGHDAETGEPVTFRVESINDETNSVQFVKINLPAGKKDPLEARLKQSTKAQAKSSFSAKTVAPKKAAKKKTR